jgi:Na+/phosphate symporter
MNILKGISRSFKALGDMYYIWKERPFSTFREISDIYHKRPLLDSAYVSAVEMLKRDSYMFSEACAAILDDVTIRTPKNKGAIITTLESEDERINLYERDIRKHILKYLAENSAPDVKRSLVLTSLVIDLEQLRDYTVEMARLTLLNPHKLDNNLHMKTMRNYRDRLNVMFSLSIEALSEKSKKNASQVSKLNQVLLADSEKFLRKLEQGKSLRMADVMFYILLTRYFQRVGGHLENISTGIFQPFQYVGFKRHTKHKPKKG